MNKPNPTRNVVKPALMRASLALMFGILAGGAFNFMLGDQGADTPAFAIYGGALVLAIFFVWRKYRARKRMTAEARKNPTATNHGSSG